MYDAGTKDFVEDLFRILSTKDYIAGHINNENLKPIAQDTKAPLLPEVVKSENKKEKEKEPPEPKKTKVR